MVLWCDAACEPPPRDRTSDIWICPPTIWRLPRERMTQPGRYEKGRKGVPTPPAFSEVCFNHRAGKLRCIKTGPRSRPSFDTTESRKQGRLWAVAHENPRYPSASPPFSWCVLDMTKADFSSDILLLSDVLPVLRERGIPVSASGLHKLVCEGVIPAQRLGWMWAVRRDDMPAVVAGVLSRPSIAARVTRSAASATA